MFQALVLNYALQIPLYLVWLVGVVLAVISWKRNPKVSLLTVIALAVFFILSGVGTGLNMWLPPTWYERGWMPARIGLLTAAIGFVRTLVDAVGFGLLLAAVFGWRKANGQALSSGLPQ